MQSHMFWPFCVVILLLVASAEAGTHGLKCKKCGPNEIDTSANECESACEPDCKTGGLSACPAICVRRDCTCADGFYRNDNKMCVPWKQCPTQDDPCKDYTFCPKGEKCVGVETDCGNPPCPLKAECKPEKSKKTKGVKCKKCGKNEKDTSKDECLNACEPTCEYPVTQVCISACVRRTCTCEAGFYRNGFKQCVPWSGCAPIPNPCTDYPCVDGETCVVEDYDCGNPPCPPHPVCKPTKSPKPGKPKCKNGKKPDVPKPEPKKPKCKKGTKPKPEPKPVKPKCKGGKKHPSTPSPTLYPRCPPRECGPNDQLINVHDDKTCKKVDCAQHQECVPEDEITCNLLDCQPNRVCRNIPAPCKTCPCYPKPTCVLVSCGDNEEKKTGCVACDTVCPGQETGEECNPICDIEDCRCRMGFYRDNTTNKCVALKDCPTKDVGDSYKKIKKT